MKYRVTIGYIDVTFDDRLEALDFAEQAKLHADKAQNVNMEFISDEVKEEA